MRIKITKRKRKRKNEKLRKENENEKLRKEYENEKNEKIEIIKRLNDDLDEIIDKSKSFEDQIKSIRKVKNLNEYYDKHNYDNKELKLKIFKLQIAHLSNIINEKLFEQIFGHTLIKLADKLINTTNKEENQIIVKNIEKNKDKLFKEDEFYNFVIQPQKRSDLKYTIDLILDFNEELN